MSTGLASAFVLTLLTTGSAARAGAGDAAIVVHRDHARVARALEFTDDRLVADYRDQRLRWDLGTGVATPDVPPGPPSETFAGLPSAASVETVPRGEWAVSLHRGTVAFWSTADRRFVHRLPDTPPGTTTVQAVLFPTGERVATRLVDDDSEVVEVWRIEGPERIFQQAFADDVRELVVAPNGASIWTVSGDRVSRWPLTEPETVGVFAGATRLLLGPGGDRAIVQAADRTWLWSTQTGARTLIGPGAGELGFLAEGARAFVADGTAVTVWDVDQGVELIRVEGPRHVVSDEGERVWTPSRVVEVDSGRATPLASGPTEWTTAAFSPDGRRLATAGGDGRITLWDVASGEPALDLWAFADGTWTVVDPRGRFDTADAGELEHVVWRHDGVDRPLTTIARTAYTPGLLGSWWRGDRLPPPLELTEVPAVPEVRLSVDPDGDQLQVRAEVCAAPGTEARDLRILVDNRLVAWRDGELASPCDTFVDRVPVPAGAPTVRVGAYAFDSQKVKSETVEIAVDNPRASVEARPKAFVINVGVDEYSDPSVSDLDYAVADAVTMNRALRHLRGYDVRTVLLADGGDAAATRGNLRAALAILGGQFDGARRASWARELTASGPDDLVIITFSGHGIAEDDVFLLLVEDGEISEHELERWLRPVLAYDLALVIDACHSGASVGESFKPGPLSSRGFGQLAYDKGMLVLAASQSDEVALESKDLQQGLVTFALVREGMEARLANDDDAVGITLHEWLDYATRRVPGLAGEVARGLVSGSKPAAIVQRPRLFVYKGSGTSVVAPHGHGFATPDAPPEAETTVESRPYGIAFRGVDPGPRVVGMRLDGGYARTASAKGPLIQSIPAARAQFVFGGRSSGERLGTSVLMGLGGGTGPDGRAPRETTPRRIRWFDASFSFLLHTKNRARPGLDAVGGGELYAFLTQDTRFGIRVRGIAGLGYNAPASRASPYLTASIASSPSGPLRQLGMLWLFRFDTPFDLGRG